MKKKLLESAKDTVFYGIIGSLIYFLTYNLTRYFLYSETPSIVMDASDCVKLYVFFIASILIVTVMDNYKEQ